MRGNWQELGEFCTFAEKFGCPVFVNTVRRPADGCLFTLPSSELGVTVSSMEKEASTLLPKVPMNLPVWEGELERIRSILAGNPSGLIHVLPNR
jgi:hypothetical protein